MAAHSQSPARLRELFAALGDDPALAAECLARPVLVDRLLRAEYARDERLQRRDDRVAKRPFEAWWNETRTQLAPEPGATDFAYRLPLIAATAGTACADDSWTPTLQLLDPRYWHTAVWTGSEMIVFGGMSSVGTTYGDGSRYDPATDTWQLLPASGSPGARQSHVAVWTGTEMVVWGGRADATGGRYNPATDSWSPTALADAPQPRANAERRLDRHRDDRLGRRGAIRDSSTAAAATIRRATAGRRWPPHRSRRGPITRPSGPAPR